MPKRKSGQMRRLAEGIYERDGAKVVKWWEPDGKGGGTRKQATLPQGTTLSQAKTFKGDKERAKAQPKQTDITCDEFAENWTTNYPRPSASTNQQNHERVSRFARDFAGRSLREVDRAEARVWLNANPSRYRAIRAMFNDAIRDGYVDENPFEGLGRRHQERGRADIVVVTAAEVDRMMQIAVDLFGPYGRVIAGVIGTAAWTGIRPGELYALEWDDVDFTNKELHVTAATNSSTGDLASPKWNSKRNIALLPQAEEVLRSVPRGLGSNVFWTQRGHTFTTRSMHHYWGRLRAVFWAELPKSRKAHSEEEAVRERKIPPGFDLYELRHHYASYLANVLEASGREIAKQMGHRDGGRLAERLYVHTEQSDANQRILERAQRVADEQQQRKTG